MAWIRIVRPRGLSQEARLLGAVAAVAPGGKAVAAVADDDINREHTPSASMPPKGFRLRLCPPTGSPAAGGGRGKQEINWEVGQALELQSYRHRPSRCGAGAGVATGGGEMRTEERGGGG